MDQESPDGEWRQASSSDPGDQGDLGDQGDASQRTISLPYTRSCDTCKRMKIKCERRSDSCVHCIERGAKCETTLVMRKKRPKRTLSAMENRIKRLESALTLSGMEEQRPASPDTARRTVETQPDLSDKLSTLLIDDAGSSHFIGASSGFSLFSPQGLKWISEKTGSNEISELITNFSKSADGPWSKPKFDLWHPIPPSNREPLPSRELADLYIHRFFDAFNCIFPLYHRASFDELLEHQYSGQPRGGVGWYASLNVVLCLGSMIVRLDERQSLGYFRNASSCFVDLVFKDCNLMAVQAICGLAVIQQLYPDPQSTHILTATAGRLAYAIGLHQKLDGFGISQQELQQRCNVFWIVYVMDKTIALRSGHPSIMIDDDIGIDLPPQDSLIEEYPDGSTRYNMFRCHAELAQLESRVYSELYSVRARSKSMFKRLMSVGELDKALQEWRLALPLGIRPGETIQCSEEQLVPVIMMQYAYFNCLTTIHRSSVHHGSWTTDGARQNEALSHHPSLNPRVYASHSICLTAARKSIELLNMFDPTHSSGHNNLTWMALYYPISGFLTLFANTLQNPQNACVVSDLEAMDTILFHIAAMAARGHPFFAGQTGRLFIELGRSASSLVETNKCNVEKAKRGYNNSDVVNAKRRPCPKESADTSYYSKQKSALSDFRAPITSDPSSQIPTSDIFTPQQNFEDQRHLHPSPNNFETDMLSLPDESIILPQDPNLIPQAPIFTGFLEWDLANIWYGSPTTFYGGT